MTWVRIKALACLGVKIRKMADVRVRVLLPLVGASEASLASLFLLIRGKL